MADNVTLPGNGDIVATDEIASAHYQFMKLKAAELGGTRDLDQDMDAPAVAGDPGIIALGRRKDVPAALVDTDGDYTSAAYDSKNRLWVNADRVERSLKDILDFLGSRSEVEDETSSEIQDVLDRIRALLDDGATDCANINVTSSTTSVPIAPNNLRRKGLSLFNDSTSILYLSLDGPASTSNFNYYVVPGAHWELPFKHKGNIFGIWTAADGFARVGDFS